MLTALPDLYILWSGRLKYIWGLCVGGPGGVPTSVWIAHLTRLSYPAGAASRLFRASGQVTNREIKRFYKP
jgi:hypothetical protein